MITLSSCLNKNNIGEEYYGGGVNVWRANVIFDRCTFDHNECPTGSGIYNEEGHIIIEDSYFVNNTGSEGWAVEVDGEDGELTLSSSCFIANEGTVKMHELTSFNIKNSNYGSDHVGCNGILSSTDNTCSIFQSDSCTATILLAADIPSFQPIISTTSIPTVLPTTSPPTVLPTTSPPTVSQPPTMKYFPSTTPSLTPSVTPSLEPSVTPSCYSKWSALRNAIESLTSEDKRFVICPGTTLIPEEYTYKNYVATDIWIASSDVQLLCGEDGNFSNDCSFEGGIVHLYIGGTQITNILVSGFTFKNAEGTALVGKASDGSSVHIVNSLFVGNSGYYGGAIGIYEFEEDEGITMHISNCTFLDNYANYGSGIFIESGEAVVSHSTFEGHYSNGWTIEVLDSGSLSIDFNCFVSNKRSIYVGDEGVINSRKYNFAEDNVDDEVEDYNFCQGIFYENESLSSNCTQFDESFCFAHASSLPPTKSPSSSEIIKPSVSIKKTEKPTSSSSKLFINFSNMITFCSALALVVYHI